MIAAPADEMGEKLDRLCAELEKHTIPLAGLFGVCIFVAAIAPAGGFVSMAAVASATMAGSGAAVGFISEWRGWVE